MSEQGLLDLGATTQADYERALYRALVVENADVLTALTMDYDGCEVSPTEIAEAIRQDLGMVAYLPAIETGAWRECA